MFGWPAVKLSVQLCTGIVVNDYRDKCTGGEEKKIMRVERKSILCTQVEGH